MIYYSGHHCFGDCFCLCAAAHLKYLETKETVKVSFWHRFSSLVKIFDGVEYFDGSNLGGNILRDCGTNPKLPNDEFLSVNIKSKTGFILHNGVSRFLKHMDFNGSYHQDICMNICRYENPRLISISVKGGTNGFISKENLEVFILRAKSFYPDYKLTFIGRPDNDISNYLDIQSKYDIKDCRVADDGCETVIEHLRNTEIFIGPHTGLAYPALGLGCRVWCESSIKPDHDFCLDFPSNRALFLSRK